MLYNSATLCHAMPCYAMLCHAMPHYAISDYYQKFSKKNSAALKFYHKFFYATASRCHLLRYAAPVPHIHYISHHIINHITTICSIKFIIVTITISPISTISHQCQLQYIEIQWRHLMVCHVHFLCRAQHVCYSYRLWCTLLWYTTLTFDCNHCSKQVDSE